jgi:TRAP-type C4-dicarboxylate transport system permease large subunit
MLSSASGRSFGEVTKMVLPWLVPLFLALALVTYVEPITMFLPGLFGYL